jgi:hypothetical protein
VGVEINQLEFRWTGEGQRGFSVVASSNPPDVGMWEERLRQVARPPAMRCPTSVVYQTFGAEAAIVFRHIMGMNTLAGLYPGQTEMSHTDGPPEPSRASLVARALVGPLGLLEPDLALACGALGLPRFLDPPPGQAQEGDLLPAFLSEDLRMRAQADNLFAQLDESARDHPALSHLVAAVLDRPATPLVLQVPEAHIGQNSTASLLWGLWRITHPILGSARDWGFSTGEPPAGNTDPSLLPDLVVRSLPLPGDPRPVVQRDELTIRPWTTGAETNRYQTEALAELLVTGYRQLPVQAFLDRVREVSAVGGTLADRLAAIADRLQPSQLSRRDQLLDRERDQAQEQAQGVSPHWPEPAAARPTSSHAKPAGRRRQGAPMALGDDAVGQVLRRLADNDIAATNDLLNMRTQIEPPTGDRRAFLRGEATRHGWFVRQFTQEYPRDVEDSLRALFTLIVEPDMDDATRRQQLRRDLISWMTDERTPDIVLLALESLFWDRRDFEFRQLLRSIAGSRWLADHGRYGQLEPTAPARAAQHATSRPRWWVLVRREHVPARLANIGVYVVLVEAIVIALLAAGWL